jgi:catechol-2,3-dioxygenase
MTTKPARLSHVVLYSTNPSGLMQWYCNVLGGEMVFDSPFFSFMTYDEEHHRVAAMLSAADSSTKTPGTGLMHLAFGFDTVGDLLDHYVRLRNDTVTPATAVHHGPTISFYYKDPEGNVLEFFVDTMPPAEATAFLTGPLYAKNPVGYEIDPDDMVAAREGGQSDAEIMAFDLDREVDVMAVLASQMEKLG